MGQPYEEMLDTFDKEDFFKWLEEEKELDKWEAALDNAEHFTADYPKWKQYADYLTVTVLNYKNYGLGRRPTQ
jgi:hypothetical protein